MSPGELEEEGGVEGGEGGVEQGHHAALDGEQTAAEGQADAVALALGGEEWDKD